MQMPQNRKTDAKQTKNDEQRPKNTLKRFRMIKTKKHKMTITDTKWPKTYKEQAQNYHKRQKTSKTDTKQLKTDRK